MVEVLKMTKGWKGVGQTSSVPDANGQNWAKLQTHREKFCWLERSGHQVDSLGRRVVSHNGRDEAGDMLASPCSPATQTSTHLQPSFYHLLWMNLLSSRLLITFLSINSKDRLQCLLSLTFQHLSQLTTWFLKQTPILSCVWPKSHGFLATIFQSPTWLLCLY